MNDEQARRRKRRRYARRTGSTTKSQHGCRRSVHSNARLGMHQRLPFFGCDRASAARPAARAAATWPPRRPCAASPRAKPGRARAASSRRPAARSRASPGSRRNAAASSAVTSILPPSGASIRIRRAWRCSLRLIPPVRNASGPAIFGVADDRMADRRHVRAQLVRAAGQRLELDPGGAVAGAVDQSASASSPEAHAPR